MDLLSVVLSLVLAAEGAVAEQAVKAAFLLNFARFVEWRVDAAAPPPAASTFNFCVLGDEALTAEFTSAFAGKSVRERPVTVRRVASATAGAAGECRVLFVASAERPRLAEHLDALGGRPVLTVSDMPGFVDAGGVIGLVRKGTNVRFEVNLAVAIRLGLDVSPRLSSIAERVVQ